MNENEKCSNTFMAKGGHYAIIVYSNVTANYLKY